MVVHWVNLAGAIVEKEVENRKAEKACKPKETLPVVEMDELFTYIKKNLAETGQWDGEFTKLLTSVDRNPKRFVLI